MKKIKEKAQEIWSLAGITIDGKAPWDIQVRNEKFYVRMLSEGSLGLGETYMDGWWTCNALDQFFERVVEARLSEKVRGWKIIWPYIEAKILNLQTKTRSGIVGEKHYDVGNDLYKIMLDKYMMYSCGYWDKAENLDEAQEDKLDLICKKLQLRPGMTLLDIGCGWGGFLKYAAKKYKIKGLGITISKEQAKLAKENNKGLPVKIELQDYRDVKQKFDRIVSIGMIEHVGEKNYKTYMKTISDCLKEDGIFLLHTIARNKSTYHSDPWFTKYIFPNSMLPSAKQLTTATEGLFVLEDWHSFGADYDKTLMAWHENFKENWEKIKHSYNKQFYRMWVYYLLSCAGSFRARENQLWQIVLTKNGIKGGYKSIR